MFNKIRFNIFFLKKNLCKRCRKRLHFAIIKINARKGLKKSFFV